MEGFFMLKNINLYKQQLKKATIKKLFKKFTK